MPGLSFYRLPLHDQNLLQRWIVNIRRENIHINEHIQVCSAHFEGGKKKGKDAVPMIFMWTKQTISLEHPLSNEILLFHLEHSIPLGSQHLFNQKTM